MRVVDIDWASTSPHATHHYKSTPETSIAHSLRYQIAPSLKAGNVARLKLFGICLLKDVLVLVPKPLGSAFFYSDLHLDTNYLRTFVQSNSVLKLIIDFKDVNYFGSELMETIDMVKQECLNHGGEVVMCRMSRQSERVRSSLSLFGGAVFLPSLSDAMTHFGVSTEDLTPEKQTRNGNDRSDHANEDSGFQHSPT